MTDLESILDECLLQLTGGASSVDEILAQHPEHAAQLRPLLQTALRFEAARSIQPSPAFKARARGQLTNYMKAHPRRASWPMMPIWRVALSAAALMVALLMAGTALAQSALPGQTFYAWKLASENIWRAVAPNPAGVDLALADRRAEELIAVAGDSTREAQALKGYLEVLGRLKSEIETQNGDQIMQALKSQQTRLLQFGISVPELDQLLSPAPATPPAPALVPTLPGVSPDPVPTSVPSLWPKIIPPLKLPPVGP